MSELDLDAIEMRAKQFSDSEYERDVFALIAEVRRLRDALEKAQAHAIITQKDLGEMAIREYTRGVREARASVADADAAGYRRGVQAAANIIEIDARCQPQGFLTSTVSRLEKLALDIRALLDKDGDRED